MPGIHVIYDICSSKFYAKFYNAEIFKKTLVDYQKSLAMETANPFMGRENLPQQFFWLLAIYENFLKFSKRS